MGADACLEAVTACFDFFHDDPRWHFAWALNPKGPRPLSGTLSGRCMGLLAPNREVDRGAFLGSTDIGPGRDDAIIPAGPTGLVNPLFKGDADPARTRVEENGREFWVP